MTGISVIICCYNSELRIGETLKYLAAQRMVNFPWEIIVVDNASTDNTKQHVRHVWEKLNRKDVTLTIADQPVQGLTHARRKGIEVSLYDIVIFCDDDNWLNTDFVNNAYAIMMSDPAIGAAGGEGKAVADGELPAWFESYKTYYACYPQSAQDGELSGGMAFLYGAGLVIRKAIFQQLFSQGLEMVTTDRSGTKLNSGGDNELSYLIRLLGYKLWYSSRLHFFHYLPGPRLTKAYLYRLITAITYSSMQLVIYHYVLAGKRVTRATWGYDLVYRVYVLMITAFRFLLVKDPFERRVQTTGSWQSFLSVLNQYGTYRKTYHRLLSIKK